MIAIENVRLFDEVQAKTRDLTEALTYQTGSANILQVIASSPTDVEPVLKAIVESACELCEAYDAVLRLKDGDELALQRASRPDTMHCRAIADQPHWIAGRALLDRSAGACARYAFRLKATNFRRPGIRARHGHRTVLSVPLLREDEGIGAIVLRRIEVSPFSDKQIALLQTFADQAVIAIENVRLFEEVQARTRDLTESLEQQTATADVLQVISRSPGDLEPVFEGDAGERIASCGANLPSISLYRMETASACGAQVLDPVVRGITSAGRSGRSQTVDGQR